MTRPRCSALSGSFASVVASASASDCGRVRALGLVRALALALALPLALVRSRAHSLAHRAPLC